MAAQRLGSRAVDAHAETQPIKAMSARFVLAWVGRGANTAPASIDFHILSSSGRPTSKGEWLHPARRR
jgi:hypothetical protein